MAKNTQRTVTRDQFDKVAGDYGLDDLQDPLWDMAKTDKAIASVLIDYVENHIGLDDHSDMITD